MGFSLGNLTGANSSAKKAAQLQQQMNKEILQNQHQWEMQDLEKANLNPALTLGDTSGSSANAGMPNMGGQNDSVFGLINSAVSAYTAKKEAETGETQGALNMAKTANLIEENPYIGEKAKAEITNNLAGATNQYAQAGLAHANQEVAKEEKNLTKENIKKTKQGYSANVFGTEGNPKSKIGKALITGASLLPFGVGVLKGYRTAKKLWTIAKFGKGLWK